MADDILIHYGVLGMKWGVRKDRGKKAVERLSDKSYSGKQRTRDRKIYGARAEKRIAKRIDKGEGIQSARHNEVVRKERKTKAKATAKRVAKTAVSIGLGTAAIGAGSVLVAKILADDPALNSIPKNAVDTGKAFLDAYLRRWANPLG